MSTSKNKATPPPYHHGSLRQALLSAGLTLLKKRGAAAVSLREAARLAGVSHNAPYRHFESREALLAALASEGFEALANAMAGAALGKEGLEALRAIGLSYIAFARQHPALYLLMFGPGLENDPFPELKAAAGRSIQILWRVIEPVTAKEVRQAAATGAWALVHGLSHLIADRQLPQQRMSENEIAALVEGALAIFRAGLVHGIAEPG